MERFRYSATSAALSKPRRISAKMRTSIGIVPSSARRICDSFGNRELNSSNQFGKSFRNAVSKLAAILARSFLIPIWYSVVLASSGRLSVMSRAASLTASLTSLTNAVLPYRDWMMYWSLISLASRSFAIASVNERLLFSSRTVFSARSA